MVGLIVAFFGKKPGTYVYGVVEPWKTSTGSRKVPGAAIPRVVVNTPGAIPKIGE